MEELSSDSLDIEQFFVEHIRKECSDKVIKLLCGDGMKGKQEVEEKLYQRFSEMYRVIFGGEGAGESSSISRSFGGVCFSRGQGEADEEMIRSNLKKAEGRYRQLMRDRWNQKSASYMSNDELTGAHDAAAKEATGWIVMECFKYDRILQQLFPLVRASQDLELTWIMKVNDDRRRRHAEKISEKILQGFRERVEQTFPAQETPTGNPYDPDTIKDTLGRMSERCWRDFMEQLNTLEMEQGVMARLEETLKEKMEEVDKEVVGRNEAHMERARLMAEESGDGLFVVDMAAEEVEEILIDDEEPPIVKSDEWRRWFVTNAIKDSAGELKRMLEKIFPFSEEDADKFYEDLGINGTAELKMTTLLYDFRGKLLGEEIDDTEEHLQKLKDGLKAVITDHVKKNKVRMEKAGQDKLSLVEQLSKEYVSKMEDFLKKNEFVDCEALRNTHNIQKAAVLKTFEEREGKKPKNELYLTDIYRLEKNMEASYKILFENGHLLQLEKARQRADACCIENHCVIYKAKLEGAGETFASVAELESESRHKQSMMKILTSFRKEGNPFPENAGMWAELNDKLKKRLQQVFEAVCKKAMECKQQAKQSYWQALEFSLGFYVDKMKEALERDALVSVADWSDYMEVEHQKIVKQTIEYFEDIDKEGVPEDAEDFKTELQKRMAEQYEKLKRDNKQLRQLAESQAKNLLNDCHLEYQALMKEKMKRVVKEGDLEKCHKECLEQAKRSFNEQCQVRHPKLREEFEEKLKTTVQDTFEEMKEMFDNNRAMEEAQAKVILIDAGKRYNEEMEKHFEDNVSFRSSRELCRLHRKAREVVIGKCEKATPLTDFQKQTMKEALGKLFLKYKTQNDMNINSELGIVPAIGIDLGTTNWCVAVYWKGRVITIPNHEQGGSHTTPSYVVFNSDGTTGAVGHPAKENAYRNPEITVYDAKRIIGRKMSDAQLRKDLAFWPFNVVDDAGVPKICIFGKFYYPEQVSAVLLAKIKEMAEKYLKLRSGTIKKAVITVPAYFNDGQRQATMDAGKLAGFQEVLTILNEPTAAAIAYTLKRLDGEARRVLIFDLGGGTFDVAVLDVKPGEIDVLGVGGDTHLGGEDFDKHLMQYCALVFKAEHGIDLLRGKDSLVKQDRDDAKRRLRRLQTYCEKTKRDLATARTSEVSVDALVNGMDLYVKVTRDDFEKLIIPFLKKTIKIVDKTLKDVGLQKEQIDDIVLVGGSTRIPKLQEMLKEYFNGKAMTVSIDPDEAIAYGAAIQAAIMNGEKIKGKIDFSKIQDVAPMSLGVEARNPETGVQYFSVIIPRNTKIPVKMEQRYTTGCDNQTGVIIEVFQGEDPVAQYNEKLGKFSLEGIPKGKAGEQVVTVGIQVNAMGILHVEAVCLSNGNKRGMTIVSDKQRMGEQIINRLLEESASRDQAKQNIENARKRPSSAVSEDSERRKKKKKKTSSSSK